jgi:hypothetical protein
LTAERHDEVGHGWGIAPAAYRRLARAL